MASNRSGSPLAEGVGAATPEQTGAVFTVWRPGNRPTTVRAVVPVAQLPPLTPDSLTNDSIASDEFQLSKSNHKKGDAETFYIEKGNSTPVLLAMALGIKDPVTDRQIANMLDQPYANVQQKMKYHPTLAILKHEMSRRNEQKGLEKPRCNNYKKQRCIDWLEINPVLDMEDIDFLLFAEKEFCNSLLSAESEKAEEAANRIANAHWTTNEPFLRLYHCICHDRARQAIVKKDNVLERPELDARNNENRPKTFEEVVTELYNDNSVIFHSKVLPGISHEFATSIELKFDEMPGGQITPEEVKSRFADARAKMISVSNGICFNGSRGWY